MLCQTGTAPRQMYKAAWRRSGDGNSSPSRRNKLNSTTAPPVPWVM
jgi:hypothetical protein